MGKRINFKKEFKLKAIEMSNSSDNIKDTAISLGISPALLYRWRKEFSESKVSGVFPGGGATGYTGDPEKDEFRRLKKEVRDLKMERDILKKAVSIFSKED
jgi:transposase